MKPTVRGAPFYLACVLASCSVEEKKAPSWIRLASRTSAFSLASDRISGTNGREILVSTDESEARLACEFRRSDWKRGPEGLWSVNLPVQTLSLGSLSIRAPRAAVDAFDDRPEHAFEGNTPYSLRDEQGEYQLWLARELRKAPQLPPRSFTVVGMRLLVNSGAAEPPDRLVLEAREQRGPVEEGSRRFRGSRFAGEALVVWPGEELATQLVLPPRSALYFGLGGESRLHWAFERGRERVYRVELDGEELFEERVACGDLALRWRSVPLPAAGGSARLSFSVNGPFAHTAYFAPTVGPLEKGTLAARPWGSPQPDVIVFVADTFRADNLAAYGGRAELAPFLNDLAARSRLFTRAWSTATYTLAAHASLFTGLFPRQAGIVDARSAVSRDLHTVAEFFTELGYRTGAVTDQGYVSQTFGMDQGFQYFDEHKRTLEETAERARAFLDADDGRPVFLFVQTYRTHKVYEVSDEACAALGLEPLSASELEALESEYDALSEREEGTQAARQRMAEIAGELERRYRGTVWDLDRGFERIFRELETRGFFRNGYLVFTSDHGEAFDEHGQLFHSGEVHEEQVRVPLFFHGPGLTAERLACPVSLVDVPPTLADLVGAKPFPGGLGTSLVDLAGERAVYAFQNHRRYRTGSTLCVIEGSRKVIGNERADEPRAGSLQCAFALESDPGELRNVLGETWPSEMFERHRAALDAALQPLGVLTPATPTMEELQSLEAMGYAGSDD